MADLTARDDRGQIILIAAFALAVTFVALALVVNSAIFTDNLASRGDTSGSENALHARHAVEQNVGRTVEFANVYNTTSQTTLQDSVNDGIANVSESWLRQHATNGASVSIEGPSSVTYGSRIAQNVSGGAMFDSANGLSDWTVVEDVTRDGNGNGTRAFEIESNTGILPDLESTAFVVEVTEWSPGTTGDTWAMKVWYDGAAIHVKTEKPSGNTEECTTSVASGADFHIDVTGGTVAGEPCHALRYTYTDPGSENFRFGAGVGDRYNVSFRNGGSIDGNYSLVTTNTSISNSNTLNSGVGSPSPYGDDAVYSVTVPYHYEMPRLVYQTDVRVAPGEPR